jgi:ABC-2 type transport system permease protein
MLKYLLEKEFKQFMRSKFLPRFVIVFPFVALAVFPLAVNFSINNINLSVVDNSRSPYSTRLVNKIASSGYFRITDMAGNYRDALKSVELDRSDVVIEIPPAFEQDLINQKEAGVMISANTVNGMKGGLGSAYLAGIVSEFSAEVRSEWMPASGRTVSPSWQIVPRYRYNPHLSYTIYMIPALMVMMLAMICGFIPALNIVGEKEKGTMEQMNVTPVNKFTFILSKLIPHWIIGFIALTICFFVAWLFYRLVPVGSIWTIYLFASVFVLAFSGFGLVISNYANTIQQAMFMMFFVVMTFVFMSGLYTPVASMPDWAQAVSRFSPLRYMIQVLRLVYLKGSGFHELVPQFLALSGFAVFFNGWAVYSYRKRR